MRVLRDAVCVCVSAAPVQRCRVRMCASVMSSWCGGVMGITYGSVVERTYYRRLPNLPSPVVGTNHLALFHSLFTLCHGSRRGHQFVTLLRLQFLFHSNLLNVKRLHIARDKRFERDRLVRSVFLLSLPNYAYRAFPLSPSVASHALSLSRLLSLLTHCFLSRLSHALFLSRLSHALFPRRILANPLYRSE